MKKLLLITLCAFAVGGAAQAAEDMANNSQLSQIVDARMKALDTDHDGKISKDEYLAMAAKKFTDNDTDHDGFMSRDELMNIKLKEQQELQRK